VVEISQWRTGAVAADDHHREQRRADDSEVEADDQCHEPSGIHQFAERGRVAPTQTGQPGSDSKVGQGE